MVATVGRNLSGEIDLISILSETDFNYLEIGCYDGCNLKVLATTFQDRKVYAIDPFISDGNLGSHLPVGGALNEQRQNTLTNINGLSNVRLFEMTSKEFLDSVDDYESMNISCIFIDGSHHYQNIIIDNQVALNCIRKNSTKNGTVVFHDVNIPDVQRGTNSFETLCTDQGFLVVKHLDQNKAVYNLNYTGTL